MGTSLLIGIITCIIYIMLANKKQQEKTKEDLVQTLTNLYANSLSNNSDVIEINNVKEVINYQEYLTTYADGVPEWKFHYVYDAKEIEQANTEQKEFYNIFKEAFKNGIYYDLENNSNYYFVLLFDLRDEYNKTKDILVLENRIKHLGLYYPKTKNYGKSILIDKLDSLGDYKSISRIQNDNNFNYTQYDQDNYKLGSIIKKKIKLSAEDVALLNKLWYPRNNFCSIEYCCIQVVKIYLLTIDMLSKKYENIKIEDEFLRIANIIAPKRFNYSTSSFELVYNIEPIVNEIYLNIFKKCENLVREKYDHKRKINLDLNYTNISSKEVLKNSILDDVDMILVELKSEIPNPDLVSEIELNFQNSTRWKKKFEILKNNYNDNINFKDDVINLAEQNKKNPSVEAIFFEASKFMATRDKEISLELYLNYIYQDILSVTFNNKQLTKTIQKSLFSNQQQLMEFENIVNDLIKDRNLKNSIDKIKLLYKTKRKEIILNESQITEVQKQHSGTVKLLNEYLEEEEDQQEIKINIEKSIGPLNLINVNSNVKLTDTQISILKFFKNSNLKLLQREVEVFAKSQNNLKNYLIESINDVCFEILDDILIEEEDEYYIINEDYFKMILNDD